MRKILSSQRGLTLIEVLATLVIMAIVSGVIYSTFTTGLKLYQKIGIEGQLRDDADYAVTMILNEMYNKPPHYVSKDPSTGGIKLVRFKPKNVDVDVKYKITDKKEIEQETLIYFANKQLVLKIDDHSEATVVTTTTDLSSSSSKFTKANIDGKLRESSIKVSSCSQWESGGTWDDSKPCQHGIISLDIVIGDANEGRSDLLKTEPLRLESKFGF